MTRAQSLVVLREHGYEEREAGGDVRKTSLMNEPYLYRKKPLARRLLRDLGLEFSADLEAVVIRAFTTIRKRRTGAGK